MHDDLEAWRERMRRDWDLRAAEDAERFIYTKSSADELDFAASGKANYDQLVRPYAPLLLNGRRTQDCDAVEIGCGIGRITEWFARAFRHVYAVDVSQVMLAKARQRLGAYSNITFQAISGSDLAPIPSDSIDLVFSYIVFQHIPNREVIDNLFRESARVLRCTGVIKTQLNGDQSPEYAAHTRDTWFGETYSVADVERTLDHAGLTAIALEGAGTQYFTVSAVKGPAPKISWVLPGEPWSSEYLLEGFGPAVDASWRPISARARVRVPGKGTRLYAGLYFWPESYRHSVLIAGKQFSVDSPGDHYFECPAPSGEIELRIDPPPRRPPAFRVIGIY